MGALQHVALPDELAKLTPAINSGLQASILASNSAQVMPNPSPVTEDQDFIVEASKSKCGVYDR
eukprot:14486337-Heterocapsa_arctica.AAC.1